MYNIIIVGYFLMRIILFALCILYLISKWIVFKKANKKGFLSVIPLVDFITMLNMIEIPVYYILLLIVPVLDIYFIFYVCINFAHAFGKSNKFGIFLTLFPLIGFPILAFSDAKFIGYQENTDILDNKDMKKTHDKATEIKEKYKV